MEKSTCLFFLLVGVTAFLPTLLACPTCPSVTPPPPPASTPCPPPPKPKPTPRPPKHVPVSSPPPPKLVPSPPSPPKEGETCPIDTLKLGACVDVLGGLVHNVIGNSLSDDCCPLVAGVSGLDAALCLCTTIKVKLLDIKVFLPIALQLLVSCGKSIPQGFQCP